MKHRISTLCLVALAVVNSSAFVPAFRRTFWSLYVPSCRPPKTVTTCLYDSTEEEIEKMSGGTASQLQMAVEEAYPNAEILTIQLQEHRPLGCTVEESVDIQSDPSITFVSKVVEGGNADKAGIKVGDVLIGVTGLFDMMPVFQSGVDKIKNIVGSVADDETLVLQLARGTSVFERHEAAIVELCQSPGASDKQVEDCVVDFLSFGYDTTVADDEGTEECSTDDESADCMIDDMYNLWADELPLPPTTSGITDARDEDTASKPKPWSARSSPSGTFVRDPVTGEMRNIDS